MDSERCEKRGVCWIASKCLTVSVTARSLRMSQICWWWVLLERFLRPSARRSTCAQHGRHAKTSGYIDFNSRTQAKETHRDLLIHVFRLKALSRTLGHPRHGETWFVMQGVQNEYTFLHANVFCSHTQSRSLSLSLSLSCSRVIISFSPSCRFSLCPRGFGRTSFRLAETVGAGRVPVFVYSDQLWVPYRDLYSTFG